jgi:GntR family transcriptional regulator
MYTTRRIDHDSPVPFYYQLKQILVEEIETGRYEPGDKLPSEHDLCQAFTVSRTVVRQALNELEMEGLLRRRKGRGTFVMPKKVSESLFQNLTGLYEDVVARGGMLRSEVRQLERVPAPIPVAAELGLREGDSVIVLDRLRLVNGMPWVVVTTYLPYELCPRLLQEDMEAQSLYAVLEQKYGIRIAYGRRSVEATAATATVARESLRGEPGTATQRGLRRPRSGAHDGHGCRIRPRPYVELAASLRWVMRLPVYAGSEHCV